MDTINSEVLSALGFRHEEFPDGWFWYLHPETERDILALSIALGMAGSEADALPDTVILQCDDTLTNWSYVYGPEVGSLSVAEAEDILSLLGTK